MIYINEMYTAFLISDLQFYNITQSYKDHALRLTAFYGVVVQWYYLYIKALLYVTFKGFKAVGVVHGVVVCKDNGKVGGCSGGCVAGGKGCKVVVVVWGFGYVWG